MTDFDRRSFLATLGVGAIGLIGCRPLVSNSNARMAVRAINGIPGKRKLERIGIQMYTVRTQARADLPGTLGQLSKIGFKEVEWWGSYSLTPTQIKAPPAQNGLAAPSVQIGVPRDAAGWAPIFESAKALKHEWIVAASPP